MPNSSSKTSKKSTKALLLPRFNSEAEEAEWYHTPEGRRFMDSRVNGATKPKRLHPNVQRTDPAVLDALVERAKAKQGPQTTAISLRVDNEDLAKAKAVAERAGIGYQALLKEIIHEGVTSALEGSKR